MWKRLLLFNSDDDDYGTLADPVDPDQFSYLELRALIMKHLVWESVEIRTPTGKEIMNDASVVEWLGENESNRVLELNVRKLNCEPNVVWPADWDVCFLHEEECDNDRGIGANLVSGCSGIAQDRLRASNVLGSPSIRHNEICDKVSADNRVTTSNASGWFDRDPSKGKEKLSVDIDYHSDSSDHLDLNSDDDLNDDDFWLPSDEMVEEEDTEFGELGEFIVEEPHMFADAECENFDEAAAGHESDDPLSNDEDGEKKRDEKN
ncbi:hypothetical protein CFOL_v3_08614 [Cephalotus follicularis]|uniref:Uncharacterized protein n=1 Tax=Cephalotus follicularis TaxID=3775 RepID=A0A1Q3BB19_CEPFO|nr:hypothetical protein CFOL_v3_08614 [Cephalotus follicularis]